MYRCYLIQNSRIAKAVELAVATLEEAIAQGRALLAVGAGTSGDSGIEVWQQANLLYSDQRHAHDSGVPAPVVSPFATPDSTMLPTTKPSRSRFMSLILLA